MNKVTILGKPSCPHCGNAQSLCKMKGLEYTYRDITTDEEAMEMFTAQRELTGQRTVPMIWIDDKFIGGFIELMGAVN